MGSRGIEIGGRCFATQDAAKVFVRAMLARYAPGDRVTDEDGAFLTVLLARHPCCEEKVGAGVDHFEVARVSRYSTKGFYLFRRDGSSTDFSFIRCVAGTEPSHKQHVSQAFRHVVREDIYAARERFFADYADASGRAPCAITGERITREQGHMDHLPPLTFEVLLVTFLCAIDRQIDEVQLAPSRDNQIGRDLAEPSLSVAFRAFHARTANLEFIKSELNLAKAQAHRIVPGRIRLRSDLSH